MLRDLLTHQLTCSLFTIRKNVEGVDHDASVRAPEGGGNSLNWIVGHVVSTRGAILELLDAEPVMNARQDALYERGSRPIGPDDGATPFEELLRLLDESQQRIAERLAAVDAAHFECDLPTEDGRTETLGLRLSTLLFHDAYHAGQVGTVRRALGMAGAIA